jgi:amino acid permease
MPKNPLAGGGRTRYDHILSSEPKDDDVAAETREPGYGGLGAPRFANDVFGFQSSHSNTPLTGLEIENDGDEAECSHYSMAIDSDLDFTRKIPAQDADLSNRATWLSCYINLTSTILGAGMLGLPYAYANMGWILGTLLILVCGTAATFALYFLAVCAKKTELPSSFYSVARRAAPQYVFIIDAIIAVKCFGVATSYLVVIGDLMPLSVHNMFPDASMWHQRNVWVGIGFAIVAPLASLRSLDSLRWTSGLSGFFLFFLITLVVAYAIPSVTGYDPCLGSTYLDSTGSTDASSCHGHRDLLLVTPSAFHVMPIFVFGYACQQNTFSIVNELQNPTMERITSVFVASTTTAVIVYIIMASAGYIAYGNTVKSNILVSYPDNTITSAARIFVSLVVAFHFPLQAHPARRSVLSLLSYVLDGGQENDNMVVYCTRYVITTVVFLACSLSIALNVSDLGLMLSLVGATGSTMISYVLPGWFYYKLHKDETEEGEGGEQEGGMQSFLVKLSFAQFVAGVLLVPLSLAAIFLVRSNGGGT